MSSLAVREAAPLPQALALSDDELIPTLRSALYPGAADASIKLVIGWCRASGKDPMKKPVHLVPMLVKTGQKDAKGWDLKEWRDVVMPGIVDYRTDAARTGEHVGNEEAVFGPDVKMNLGGVEITFPEWCEFVVLRLVEGQARRFSSGKVRWLETYATAKSDTLAPNAMWRKRPYGQLEKCAEALALRRGFPEVGSQPTIEEMEGREEFVVDGVTITDTGAGQQQATASRVARKTTPKDVEDVTPAGAAAAPAAAASPAPAPAATPAPAPATGAQQGLDMGATPAPPAPPAQPATTQGAEFVGAGEQAFLTNKAKSLGLDIKDVLAQHGGLLLDRLTKGDFEKVKADLRAREA